MPHWEDELRTLLESLGVRLEERVTQPRMDAAALFDGDEAPTDSMVREWEAQQQDDGATDGDDAFSMINREMEVTVQEVARLVNTGRLEPSLRDDVVHVLRALTRPAPASAPDPDEWRYTSAAAVLHFCRLVLRLANELTRPE